MRQSWFYLLFFLAYFSAYSQDTMPAPLVICEAVEGQTLSAILPTAPTSNKNARTALNFVITYDSNFPAAGKAAVQKATSIWASYLTSNVPIYLKIFWENTGTGVLAKTGATKIQRNFSGAIYQNVWYPEPLAEALSGKDMNNGDNDIEMHLSNQFLWNYATDGRPVFGQYDMVSVILHELAHGLGFSSTFALNSTNSSQGQWGQSSSGTSYDINIQDAQNRLLTNTGIFGNPSTGLKTAMTSGALYYAMKGSKYKSNFPRLYAPNPYVEGTSISHLDESTYPTGNANALMSPRVQSGEVVQSPGDIVLNIFAEMGWYVNTVTIATATESLEPTTYSIKVFPNPSNDFIHVAIPDNGITKDIVIEIMNLNGQQISILQEKNILSKTYQLPIQKLSDGIYLLRISDGTNLTVRRFLKM